MKENNDIVIENLPKVIFIIPMRGCPVFPGLYTTIEVSDKQDIEIIRHCERFNGFGLVMLKSDGKDNNRLSEDDFYKVGTFVRIKNQINTIYGTKSLFLETVCRFKIDNMLIDRGTVTANVTYIQEDELSRIEDKAFTSALREALDQRADRSVLLENLRFNASNIPEAIRLADYLASSVVPRNKQQELLEEFNGKARIMKVLHVLQEELAVQHMHDEIQGMVSKRIDSRQREYFLREEMRFIRKQLDELGHGADELDSEESEEETEEGSADKPKRPRKPKLIDRLKALNLTGETYETVMDEYQKMASMDTNNPEYSMVRTYLEMVADLPWNNFSPDDFSLEEARKILEQDHYGIKDVKDRVLEFLAVRKLRNDTKGSIICLVGPPGTGKTSIGISIAKALKKKYYRFSVGGMRDEAEIKGHRRTYIGAMPGQIIKGLRVTKTKNPVFVIDEVD
ncbi:MAG: LON peptidase substrate-binding domain-containing protein, partial [Spirochaetales bacterium]|nr:LON peptidase substrate-binding domain-containing protein [Spirochaetales bacterium]